MEQEKTSQQVTQVLFTQAEDAQKKIQSSMQVDIGGAKHRAKVLEEETVRIQCELKYWNDLYSQETSESR